MDRRLLVVAVAVMLAVAGCAGDGTGDGGPEIDDDPEAVDDAASDTDDGGTSDADDEDSDTDGDPADDSGDSDQPPSDDDETEEETDDADEGAVQDGPLEVHAINVGQADATLVVSPSGETILIDTGDWPNDGQTVISYLDTLGIDRIDHLVSTHPHADHIGGHAAVIEHFETEKDGIGAIWDPGVTHTTQTYDRYLDAVEEHNVTLFRTQQSDNIPIDGVNATILNPPADSAHPDEFHYNSIALIVEHGDTAFLATGDAEIDAEDRMLDAHGQALEADLYHAGHHGSRSSSSADFLDTVDPRITIISAAYDSQYGHPHEEVLERFATREIEAVWTGIHGTIVFESDGETFTAVAQSNATTNPLALREEPAITAPPTAEPEYQLPLDGRHGFTAPDDQESGADDGDDSDGSDDGDGGNETASPVSVAPTTASSAAEHTWRLEEIDFEGEVDEISVAYPDAASFDGLNESDVTVTMTRQLSDGTDTSEIRVNNGQYSGSGATFDLDGRYTTNVAGPIEVVINGLQNPDAGNHTATITLHGEDDELAIDAAFEIE